MRAKFVRGQDPKDSMDIGLVERRNMERFLDEMVETHGGEQSIIEKRDPKGILHYLEGCWTTDERWKFWLFYDFQGESEENKWFVGTGKIQSSNLFGKYDIEEASEWIRLQYKSKRQTEDFNRFAQEQMDKK